MNIELSKNSWHRNIYEFFWMHKAPENLCNYFWGFVISLVMTIPFLPGRIFYEMAADYPKDRRPILKTVLYPINTLIILGVSGILDHVIGSALFYPVTALAAIGFIVLFVIVFGIILYIFNETKFVEGVVEISRMTSSTIKAKKNKVCPKINWK